MTIFEVQLVNSVTKGNNQERNKQTEWRECITASSLLSLVYSATIPSIGDIAVKEIGTFSFHEISFIYSASDSLGPHN